MYCLQEIHLKHEDAYRLKGMGNDKTDKDWYCLRRSIKAKKHALE